MAEPDIVRKCTEGRDAITNLLSRFIEFCCPGMGLATMNQWPPLAKEQ
jgi:hypothetical protein